MSYDVSRGTFQRLLYASAASAAADLNALPTQGSVLKWTGGSTPLLSSATVLPCRGARYVGVRAWSERGAAADETATVDLNYGWGNQRGMFGSRLVFTFGTDNPGAVNPLETLGGLRSLTPRDPDDEALGDGDFYEADHVYVTGGNIRPVAISRAEDGQMTVWLPTAGAVAIVARCQAVDAAGNTVLVGGLLSDDYDDSPLSAAPVAATGTGTITAANGRAFSWPGQQSRIEVWNGLTAAKLYGKRDSSTADNGDGEWDFLVFPETVTVIRGSYYRLALYSTVAATEGVDYAVLGVEGGVFTGG